MKHSVVPMIGTLAVLFFQSLEGIAGENALRSPAVPSVVQFLNVGNTFENAAAREAWKFPERNVGWLKTDDKERGTVLEVRVPNPDGGKRPESAAGSSTVDLKPFAGKTLRFAIDVMQEDVSVPKESYNGVKVMVCYSTPKTGQHWDSGDGLGTGSVGWRRYSFSARIPDDATNGALVLGLADSSGRVCFDNLKMSVDARSVVDRKISPGAAAELKYGKTRSRGMMVSGHYKDGNLPVLAGWGANLIRFQIVQSRDKKTNYDLESYRNHFIKYRLADLDQTLKECAKLGLKVVIDLHTPPGGCEDGTMIMFHEPKYADAFVDLWRELAARYKDNPAVYGYDLINEPEQSRNSSEPGAEDFWQLQVRAAQEIRKIDPNTPIIFEVDGMDNPDCFRFLPGPAPVSNAIYQAHIYNPWEYTHQKVGWAGMPELTYPGCKVREEIIDKQYLRRAMQSVRDFQLAYNVPIYIGEFSAVRWAPGASHYVDDCISLFEEYGWDWSYHAFREWDAWSVEHEGAFGKPATVAAGPTATQKVFQKWFARNREATFESRRRQ